MGATILTPTSSPAHSRLRVVAAVVPWHIYAVLFASSCIIVGVICAELLTQHSKKPIFLYLLNAYGYFTPGIATMFLLGILWKRTTTSRSVKPMVAVASMKSRNR